MTTKRALSARVVALVAAILVSGADATASSLGTWREVKSGTANDFEAVAFGNGTFVAVGAKGLIVTSQDGLKWTKRSAGINRTFNDVTFSSSRFIAVCKAPDSGVGAKIWVSDDNGASWKYRDTDAGDETVSVGMHAVAGDGNGNLVAVGGMGWVTRSHDNGQTWQVLTTRFTTTSLYGVAWGKGVWIATGPGGVFRSPDASAWTTATETFPAYKAGFGNNRFVVTADAYGGGFKSSSDGNKWTQCVKASAFLGENWPGYSNGVAFGDGIFVVSGGNGDLWTSETGLVWKRWTSPLTGTELMGAAFGQRMFIAAGYKGRMASSPPWMKARLGSTWDYPLTVFDAEDGLPRRIGLPEYRVNTASLNLVLEATLFYMPTPGVPVNLRLVYASAPTEDGADTIGLFGKNWRFRYESMIGQFGAEAEVISGGGRSATWGTPKGEELATATLGTPITLVPPAGVFDELKFYGPGNYFELKEKASKLTYRYAVAGGPGNALWRLTRITDRSGNQLNFIVNGTTGAIASITDASGRTVSFTYNLDNLCTRITVPGGRHIDFSYDYHKNLTGITDMAGYVGSYTYDDLGFLLRMNTAGRVNSFTYADRPGYEKDGTPPDGEGAGDQVLASVTNAQGNVVKYELLPKDGGVKRTDARGETMTFKSKAGQTTDVTDPLGNLRSVQYSDAKIPTSFTDELGSTTGYDYDLRGNLTKLTDALGKVTTFTYDARDNALTRTNAFAKTWTYTYDASDRVLTTRSPIGNTTTFGYFANGRLNTVRDARSNTTTFAYDGYGNLVTVTDPAGGATSLGYDASGLHCTLMTDPRGKQKALQYDANDRLTRVTYSSASGAPARVNAYDAIGQTSFTDELGNITRVLRNDFGFPTQITDPLGHVVRTEYDPNNNPVKVTDPLGRVTTTTYDDMNRPLVFTDARARTIKRAYDDAGNLLSLTDKRGNTTRFDYDENHRLVKTTDPLGKAVATGRDALGRIETITNARGQQIRFTYDDDGRMTKKEYLASVGGSVLSTATFTLDANGNVTSRTDDWGTLTRIYDANNLPTSITYPGGKTATFTYNAAGLLASATYPNGLVVTYTYDNFNRLVVPARFRSSAELAGNGERQNKVTTMTIALGGTTHTITFALDGTGSTTGIVRPGNTQTNFTYDTAHRLTAIDHQYLGATFFKTALGLNAVGSVLHETRTGTALLNPALPLPMTQTFDAANQLKTSGGKPCSYDADGNLTAIGTDFIAKYSPENRPTQIVAGGTTVNYTYDAMGQRVKREVVGGATTNFHYAPTGELLFTTDGAGTIQRCFVWNGKALFAILTGTLLNPDLRYTHLDRLGNVVALTGTGTAAGPQAKYAYQPYGASYAETVPVGGTPETLFTFVGGIGVQQENGGLYYMQNRFYDSTSARFLQRDPAGFEGGVNLYAYVAGNPATHSDPTGLDGLFGVPTNAGSSGFEFLINTVWKAPTPTVPGVDPASSSGFEFVKKIFTDQALNAEKAAGQAGGSYGLAGKGSRVAVNTVSELTERKALQSATTTGVELATTGVETAAAVEETVIATGLRTAVSGGVKLAARTVVAPWFAIGTGAEIAGWATGSDDVSAAGEAMTGVIWPSSWKTAWDYWTSDDE